MARKIYKPPSWTVVEVKPVGPLTFAVCFIDGTEGTVRFEALHLRGVFTALKDPVYFAQVYVDDGVTVWPGGQLDLAPDAMYEEIKEHGEWVLR
jgi:hypothetical protein